MIITFKSVLFVFFYILQSSHSLKVVVSGYNTRIATYEVSGSSLTPSGEWDVGADNKDMTWLQLDGPDIWAGHEVFHLLHGNQHD